MDILTFYNLGTTITFYKVLKICLSAKEYSLFIFQNMSYCCHITKAIMFHMDIISHLGLTIPRIDPILTFYMVTARLLDNCETHRLYFLYDKSQKRYCFANA